MFTKTASIALALAVSVGAAAPAAMANDLVSRNVEISYSDLNLSSREGQEQLHRRIVRAAELACAPAEPKRLGEKRDFNACREAAISAVVPKFERIVAAAASRQVADNK
jgi:UrcA family protein